MPYVRFDTRGLGRRLEMLASKVGGVVSKVGDGQARIPLPSSPLLSSPLLSRSLARVSEEGCRRRSADRLAVSEHAYPARRTGSRLS